MSKRAQLHGLVRNLRQYLEWQAVPLAGSVPAPEADKAALARNVRERERAKLDATLGRSPEPPKREPVVPTTTAAPASPVAPGRVEEPRREVPQKREPEPKKEPANALWKSGFGAQPRKTFDEGEKPKPKAPKQRPAEAKPEQRKSPERSETRQNERSKAEAVAGTEERPTLEAIRAELGDCRRCGLCETRTNIVFGVGSPTASIMFIGEAPGYNEDKQGEPFVGKAGALLDKMIGAMTLSREKVYIANVIKCRPPDNRDPSPDEVRTCSPFLEKQVAAIQPDVIVALGKFASNLLTGNDGSLGKIRGRWHEYEGVPVMPTYHPAYLLRSPQQKGKAWDDLKKVMVKAGLDIPERYR